MTSVNIYEAKTQLSRLIERVQTGEEIVIANNGRPVARLTAYAPTRPPRVPGGLRGRIVVSADFDDTPAWVIEAFEGQDR